jgi:hypothetical protein
MTEEELKEIENRNISGTNGPWIAMTEGITHTSGEDFIMTGVKNAEDYKNSERGNDIYLINGKKEDLIFIANAKQDIPKLIAEIRKLKKV